MLKQQLAEVQEQANSLKSENESLTEEKDIYQRKLNVLTDTFEKIR